jgi:hypothetical protein
VIIPLDDPADLPTAVRAFRHRSGEKLNSVSRRIAAETMRTLQSVNTQIGHWEFGRKSPQLATLGPYLRGHRLQLALVPQLDTEVLPPCTERSDLPYITCVLPSGHGGSHRTYDGRDFR